MKTTASPAPQQTLADSSPWPWLAVLVAGVIMIVQKPWALFHAQLWAEDGSVHLLDNEVLGLAALVHPYRGYLHLLPRLIAWLASQLVDIAYWPIFYNAAALLVAIAVLARLCSSRLDLPAKPWLILSLVLAVSTGEVFLNITNLHWLTAFLILMQAVIAVPKTVLGWIGDFLILPVVGLTGPFVAVLMPLFAWRLWRERNAYSLAVFLIAGLCASIQAYLVVTTGPTYFTPVNRMDVSLICAAAGCRYVVWPLFGPKAALGLPDWALSILGGAILALLMASAFRPGRHRLLRQQVLVALVLLAAIGLYRIRPDSWGSVNIELGDSYFFIPRILAMWLLVWCALDPHRAIAWSARGLCVLGIVSNLTDMIQPAPVDFNWMAECQTIRSGTAAKIPIQPEGWILQYPGRDEHVEPAQGWYGPEQAGARVWRWCAGEASLHVGSRYFRPVRIILSLRSLQPEVVTIAQEGVVIWRGPVNQQYRRCSIPVQMPQATSANLVLTADHKGIPEAAGAQSRVLAFAISNWSVEDAGPARQ